MTIDLISGRQRAPRSEDYMTRSAAVAPDHTVAYPLWQAFLARVTNDDIETQGYLKRVIGYCLTGHTTEHALFFLYGTGANGKSVFIKTVTGIMGDYAISAPMEAFVEARGERHPTELAMLQGARLVVASETEEGRKWNESRIKALTGGDIIAARFMRGDFFQFVPSFKLMIAGNHKPALRNVDDAIRRRIHLIPFAVTIPAAERDQELETKLKAEWPGIMQWAVDGCQEWQQQGLNPPPAVVAATDDYVAAEDTLGCWLDESVESGNSWGFESTAELFASWKKWADLGGESMGSKKRFSQMMVDRGYAPKRQSKKRGFTGIRLLRISYSDKDDF